MFNSMKAVMSRRPVWLDNPPPTTQLRGDDMAFDFNAKVPAVGAIVGSAYSGIDKPPTTRPTLVAIAEQEAGCISRVAALVSQLEEMVSRVTGINPDELDKRMEHTPPGGAALEQISTMLDQIGRDLSRAQILSDTLWRHLCA